MGIPPRAAPARTATLVSLGCKVNQGELRQWGLALARAGVSLVDAGSEADLAIVNTCAVTCDGDKASRKAIRQAARRNPDSFVVATGCYASIDPEAVADATGVDLVVANADKDTLVQRLVDLGVVAPGSCDADAGDQAGAAQPAADAWTHRSERPGWVTRLPALERKARAFVKVQDGCNSHCTYCIVPAARGPQRSRSIRAVVDEIGLLYRLGYREAVLSGVQIGAYGSDWDRASGRVRRGSGPSLTALVERILIETPMPRVRISSIQPQDWPPGLLDLWQDSRLCRHLHLPLQSGSDSVLRRMVRRYRVADFRTLVERVRAAVPEIAITADLMVAFPGESEAEHAASLDFVGEMAFAEQHVFRYSPRPGTAAVRLADEVPPDTAKRRAAEARALDADQRARYQEPFVGRTVEVLWEEPIMAAGTADEATWSGLTDNYLRVQAVGRQLEGVMTPTRLLRRTVERGQPVLFGELAGAEAPVAR